MTTQPDSNPTGYLEKLRAMTASWFSLVLFYLVLVAVFFVIDRLVVADLYRRFFYYPGSIFNVVLMGGGWLPGLANAIVIVLAARAKKLSAYLLSVAVLTYILSIAYFYLSGLDITYRNDPESGVGIILFWGFNWFWGGMIGFVISLMIRRK